MPEKRASRPPRQRRNAALGRLNSIRLYVPTATGAFDASSATVFFAAAAIRRDRLAVFGRAGTAARRRRGRAGVSGLASSARRCGRASSVSHTAAAARFSRGGRSGVCGATTTGAVDRTSSRRDASSHRRLPPAPAQGRARKHLAQRQWSQRRRPRSSTTPQSGHVKRGGAMVLKSSPLAGLVLVTQKLAARRAVALAQSMLSGDRGSYKSARQPRKGDGDECALPSAHQFKLDEGGSLNFFSQGLFGWRWLRC